MRTRRRSNSAACDVLRQAPPDQLIAGIVPRRALVLLRRLRAANNTSMRLGKTTCDAFRNSARTFTFCNVGGQAAKNRRIDFGTDLVRIDGHCVLVTG